MAFDNRPKYDDSTINDGKAQRRFNEFFNTESGFQPRDQVPDKGIDYQLELIGENGYTNHHTSIQLKSIVNSVFVQDGKYISYPFKTSRLAYLSDSLPVRGLFVLYDINTKTLYYEYGEKLIIRLMNERDSESWRQNETVNILIPTENIVTSTVVASIHRHITERFENQYLLYQQHGHQFNIPNLSAAEQAFNFKDPGQVMSFLTTYGKYVLNEGRFDFANELIGKLTNTQISSSKDLLKIAVYTYAAIGKIAESNFYADRLFSGRHELSLSELNMLKFTNLKNELYLGKKDRNTFVYEGNSILENTSDRLERIFIRLNIQFYQLQDARENGETPNELTEAINNLTHEIVALDESVSDRYQYQIWNSENIALWIAIYREDLHREYIFSKYLGMEMTIDERLQRVKELATMHRNFYAMVLQVEKYASDTNDQLLLAQTISAMSRFKKEFELHSIRQGVIIDPSTPEMQVGLMPDILKSSKGIHIFSKKELIRDAYELLCCQFELIFISRNRYQQHDSLDLEYIQQFIDQYGRELELPKFEPQSPALLAQLEDKNHQKKEFSRFIDLGEVEALAAHILSSGKFPNAKLEYLCQEFNSMVLFHQRGRNDLEIYFKPEADNNKSYTAPTEFWLKDIKTGKLTERSTDMDTLLKCLGH